MPAPPQQPTDFRSILEQVWWRLDTALDLDAVDDPRAALGRALSARGPMLIHARIDMREQVLPMVAPGASNKDMIEG